MHCRRYRTGALYFIESGPMKDRIPSARLNVKVITYHRTIIVYKILEETCAQEIGKVSEKN